MALKPWYKVATPREDLREGKPLDAAEFAVHLDQVRDGRATDDYQKPERFFGRTYLTKSLGAMAAEVVRRLSGERTETSAVFNMTTQFGGGKTHALTLLYHLAIHGNDARDWPGVSQILERAGVKEIPRAATAVFVGTEFDSIKGRGGDDGTPLRRTPWGEIAFQLAGQEGFEAVAEHEAQRTAPAGEVIRQFLPRDRPSLILVDELLNYVNRNRKSGLGAQLHSFVQNLSEEARGSDRVVLVASVPASEMEMTAEDQSDYERFKKLLDRLGKAVVMSAEAETSEIIRRRLFEWDPRAVSSDGRVLLPREAVDTCTEYAHWIADHQTQIPSWFSADHARAAFEATYPFHPMVLSVFERKWQELPRFQRTRGVLRLLALWVSHAYRQGFHGAERDPMIGMGTAPLADPTFRSAVFEQLGESRLEGALTTDICGKPDSHAVRLDEDAVETLRKGQVHRKVATVIFFESNGGQTKNEATLPEVRLAVAGPDVEIGNVETALEALSESCYYLTAEGTRYRFSLKENLNKRFADRRASVRGDDIERLVLDQVEKIFPAADGIERVFFPEQSAQVPDRPVITFVVLSPEQAVQDDPGITGRIEEMIREHGKSARTFKSALVWIVPEAAGPLRDEARKLLAWEDISNEGLKLDDIQAKQLDTSVKRARRDLTETVWRAYKNIFLLGRDNTLQKIDLGLIHSSAAESLTRLVLSRLRQTGEIETDVSPRFLAKHWPPAFEDWSTRSVRDAFFASPQFPRLLRPDTLRETIARGVSEGYFGYGEPDPDGGYRPFHYKESMIAGGVDVSDEAFLLPKAKAELLVEPPHLETLLVVPANARLVPGDSIAFVAEGHDQHGRDIEVGEVRWTATGGEISADGNFDAGEGEGNFVVTAAAGKRSGSATVRVAKADDDDSGKVILPPAGKLVWSGEIPAQKWTNFYMKVLTRLVSAGDVKLTVTVEARPKDGVTDQQVEETRAGLRGIGLEDDVRTE